MPLQIWTRDQAPELAVRGGQFLGAGIAGAGAAIGAGIGKRLEESKRLNTAGKASKTFLEALNEASGGDDEAKEARKQTIAGLSSQDAVAEMTAALEVQGYKKGQADLQEALNRALGLKAETENLAKAPAFFKRAAEAGTAPGELPFDIAPAEFDRRTAPLDARALIEAAGTTGYNPGNQVDDLLRALQTSKGGAMDLLSAFEMARNPPPGFSPGGVQINPNGTPGLQFAPVPPAQPPANIPAGLEPRSTTIDPQGKQTTTYGITDKAKALTDAQANALQYSERMKFNNGIIESIEQQGFSPATVEGYVKGGLPNWMAGEMSQQYQAAAKNWISAVLRKESGAAISKSEESGAMHQYFPKLGDAPTVIKQKAELRRLAEDNMRRAIGSIDEDKAKGTNAPVAAVVEEAPKDPAKRKKNAVYQTPQRGPMRWTGTGWVAP